MDSKIRNLAIVVVVSVLALIGGLVVYENKKNDKIVSAGEDAVLSENEAVGTEEVYGPGLTEAQLHSFMQDDTFWDPEPSLQVSSNEVPRLYLLASSVQQDIRVAVVDENGETITGHSFFITIDDNQYKDLDQDGIIYIPDMRAGDYMVSLNPESGYQVPQDPMRVTVKEQLEYTVIEDISYLIMTEDQINAAIEDTRVADAREDADGTENTGMLTNTGTAFGIDVSKWQQEIDWEKVAAAGVQFAIVRCGYRGSASGCLVEDPYFVRNIEGAKNAGIRVGVYFFTQAVNEVEAVEEASMVATLCRDYELDYPVFIDTEGAGGQGRADALSVDERTAVCNAFCKTIESEGYEAGIYASRCWFYEKLHDDELQDYFLWVAEYRNEPIYTGNYKMWQYTSSGYIDGISTRVDMDISYR